MLRIAARIRVLALLVCFVAGLFLAGCESQPTTGPQVSEQERKEMIRRDAEQMMKERQQGSRPRPSR